MCEAPVAADDAGLLSVEGQGDGTDVIGVYLEVRAVDVGLHQDGYPSSAGMTGPVSSGCQ